MNKQFFNILDNYFNLEEFENFDKLYYIIINNLKKFKISKKKRFFIKYKYPHRRSESHYKSCVTLKRYLVKEKKWYSSKKKCLIFKNFFKLNNLITLNYNFNNITFLYDEDN